MALNGRSLRYGERDAAGPRLLRRSGAERARRTLKHSAVGTALAAFRHAAMVLAVQAAAGRQTCLSARCSRQDGRDKRTTECDQ